MLVVFCNTITPRLQYICDLLLRSSLGIDFALTSENEELQKADKVIYYGKGNLNPAHFSIHPHGLLEQQHIKKQSVTCFQWKESTAFFKTDGDDLGFDIFAAAFYLISRYEEYLPHQRDSYGRFDHHESLAYREGFLHLPLVNIWLTHFSSLLKNKFPDLVIKRTASKTILTYDIDIAWSYRHKGMLRNLGGIFKGQFANRMKVLTGEKQDPFDCYDKLDEWHQSLKAEVWYFFLMAKHRGIYDKNISPTNPAMQELIRRHATKYLTGIHPSWASGDNTALLQEEIESLANITKKSVAASRQHYIRMNLPVTYHQLISAGIQKDFSMGYGSINGFRASYAGDFFWYDLKNENTTALQVFPFCYMEANSFYEQKQSAEDSLKEIMHYHQICEQHHGLFISIFHNHFLGEDPLYKGWKEMYAQFISQLR